MSLREKLKRDAKGSDNSRKLIYEHFGFIDNPFPAAGQPTGHPRMDDSEADEQIVSAIEKFDRDHTTQVLLIEGTQGIGKTNLLNYYQQELQDLYREDETFYIIRYYPDPEPTFDAIVRRIFQELGHDHLISIAQKLSELADSEAQEIIELARAYEVRIVLNRLRSAGTQGEIAPLAEIAMEWLVGLRVLNRHREGLGVQFRLDTVESRTQALRDIVFISEKLSLLRGIFLLLDELEKQDYSLSKTPVLRYLSAIRALIDALPRRLFLMVALTVEARRRYFSMLPAIASRLQTRVSLSTLKSVSEGMSLVHFYHEKAKERAKQLPEASGWDEGDETLFTKSEISRVFDRALKESADRGIEGVIHRDFLNRLHFEAENRLKALGNE